MKKLYCVICRKHRKLEKSKISYLLKKKLVLSIICNKLKNEDGKITWRRIINWDIKNFWLNSKYIITLKIWPKKIYVKNLD